jgi:hypothetical protein
MHARYAITVALLVLVATTNAFTPSLSGMQYFLLIHFRAAPSPLKFCSKELVALLIIFHFDSAHNARVLS